MSSPLGDVNTNVNLTATATFAQVISEAKKAERAIQDLQNAEDKANRASVKGSRDVASAVKTKTDAISSQASTARKASADNEKYAKSFDSISSKVRAVSKDFKELDSIAKSFTNNNNKLADSFDRLNRSQSGRSSFARNTRTEIDQASQALEQFENRLRAVYAASQGENIDLRVDSESALNEIAKIAAEIQLLTRGVNEVEIRINANKTLIEARSLAKAIKREFKDVIDTDALGASQARFREIARDIAAEASEFRREQQRLDRELLEEQLEFQNRFRAPDDRNTDRDGARREAGLLDELGSFLDSNSETLKQVAESFENAISDLNSKLDELKNSSDGSDSLAESISHSAEEVENAAAEFEVLNRRIKELEENERALAAEQEKNTAKTLSDQEKIRQSIRQTDLENLKGDKLRQAGKDLGIRGSSRMRVGELREEIAKRITEPSLTDVQAEQNRARIAAERNAAALELTNARTLAREKLIIIQSNARQQEILIRAQADREREADRLNSRLTIADRQRAERIRQESVRRQIEDARRVARERENAEKATDRVLRDLEKSRLREAADAVRREYAETQRQLRDSISPRVQRGTRANLLRIPSADRTDSDRNILDLLTKVTAARRDVNRAIQQAKEAQDRLLREISVADDIESRIRAGQNVGDDEISEHKQELAIARQEAKETEDLLNQTTRLRQRAEQDVISAVLRAEREKRAERSRTAREAEREANKLRKEQERIAKLPIGEQLGIFARNVARDMVVLFNDSRKTEGRLRSFKDSFILLRREVAKGLKIEGGENFGSNLAKIFRQVGDSSGSLLKSLTKVRGEIFRMPGVIFLLVSSFAGLVAGLGSVGAGFLGLANSVVSALGILGAAPGIFAAVAAAAGAITLGTSGIGDALKAASDVNEKKAEAKASGSDKDDSVTKARQLRAATRGYEDALDSLSDAQKDQKKAQQDIAKAWREAKEDLIDLQYTVRQGVIDEERAIINLRKARLELAKIQAGGTEDPEKAREALKKLQEARKEYNKVLLDGNSNAIERAKALRKVNEAEIAYAEATRKRATRDDRKSAELDVKDAELALEKIRERNKRDQRDLNKLQEEGLGKSDKVVSANERLADANDRVADAQEAVAEAAERLKEVNSQTAKSSDAAAKAQDKLEAIYAKMSVSQRKFAEYVVGMLPQFEQLKKILAEEIFRPVADDLSLLNDVLALTGDFLRPTATAIGLLFEQGLKLITSGPFRRDFKTIGKDSADVIKSLGEAALDVVTAFKDITVAAGDFTKDIAAALGSSAEEFKNWAARVRRDGSLKQFLDNAQQDLGVLSKIFRNLGATFVSYFKATEDQGDYILARIKLMTDGWRKVAKAQEAANSPLKKFLEDSRPALGALTSLFGAIGAAVAGIAARPENLEAAVEIFEALEKDVLPPLVDIINTLSDTGLAAGLVDTIGEVLRAIAEILDNGGALALVVYAKAIDLLVTTIAKFVALPGVSHLIGGIAIALAGVAAAATVTKFLGLIKLLEFFQWVNKNGKGVADKLNNIGDGVDKSTKNNSSSKNSKTDNPTLDDAFDDFDDATDKVDKLDKKMDKAKGTAGKLKGAFGKLGDALGSGGFAGLGVAAAILAFEFIAGKVQESDTKVENLKDSLLDAAGAFKEAGPAGLNAVSDIVKNNEQLAETIILLDKASKGGKGGPTPTDLLKGIGGDFEAYRRVVDDLNAQIDLYDKSEKDGGKRNFLGLLDADEATQRAALVERRKAIRAAWMEAEKQREADKALAGAQPGLAGAIDGATGAQKNFNFQSNKAKEEMRELAEQQVVYSEAIKVINDPLATVEERTQALADINKILYGRQKSIIEQNDEYEGQLLNLKEAVDQNGTSLKNTTREGQNNREMLKTAATAAKNFYEQDIAAKVPQQEANKRYQERIENLKELAKKLKLNEEETKNLIAAYGGIETNINTVISMTGDDDVKRALLELAALQLSLKNPNLTPSQARDIVNKDLALERQAQDRAAARKPAPKKAYGGFVSGPGGPRDDQIPAWLSNEEFVQPADATKHYGVPFMEKLRRKQIPKQAVQKIEGMGFSTGGHVGCEMCASGQAHAQKYATGGMVKWPFKVDVSKSKTDFDVAAAENPPGSFTGSVGSGKPGSGYQWLIKIARLIDPNARVISTVRPGDRTLSGSVSLHAQNKAVDFSPSRKLAEGLYTQYGKQMQELITPWRDLMLYRGKPAKFNRAIEAQHGVFGQNAHVHAGTYAAGGLVRNPFDFGTLRNRVSPVSTPRALSQAAREVINNSSDNKEVNYNVTVNNPLQERAGDSIRSSVARTVYFNELV